MTGGTFSKAFLKIIIALCASASARCLPTSFMFKNSLRKSNPYFCALMVCIIRFMFQSFLFKSGPKPCFCIESDKKP